MLVITGNNKQEEGIPVYGIMGNYMNETEENHALTLRCPLVIVAARQSRDKLFSFKSTCLI